MVTSAFSWMEQCLTLHCTRRQFCSEQKWNQWTSDTGFDQHSFCVSKSLPHQPLPFLFFLATCLSIYLSLIPSLHPPFKKKIIFPSVLLCQCLGIRIRICYFKKHFPRVAQENQSTESWYILRVPPETGLQAVKLAAQAPLQLSKRIQASHLKTLSLKTQKHGLQWGRIKHSRAMEENSEMSGEVENSQLHQSPSEIWASWEDIRSWLVCLLFLQFSELEGQG